MADEQRKGGKESFRLPGWIAVVVSVLAIIVGGAGWISSALTAQMDARTIKQDQEISQLQHEQSSQGTVIIANTNSISDLRADVAAIKEQTKRLTTIEALLTDLLRKMK